MSRNKLEDALSFVNEPLDSTFSLSTKKKSSVWWLHWLGAFSVVGVFLAVLRFQGYLKISAPEKLTKPQSKQVAVVLPSPPVLPIRKAIIPRAQPQAQAPVSPQPHVVQVPPKPQDPPEPDHRRPSEARNSKAKVVEKVVRQDPRKLLEEKGLKPVGKLFVLKDKETVAITRYEKELPNFVKRAEVNALIYRIDQTSVMLKYAQQLKDGLALNIADLNNEMDRVPRWGLHRENDLNSVQRGMHQQLLSNRQDITNLDRVLTELRFVQSTFPPRGALVSQFNELTSTCRNGLAEIEPAMQDVEEKYDELRKDDTVQEAIDADNRQTHTNKLLGMTDKFKKRLQAFKVEKRIFDSLSGTGPR